MTAVASAAADSDEPPPASSAAAVAALPPCHRAVVEVETAVGVGRTPLQALSFAATGQWVMLAREKKAVGATRRRPAGRALGADDDRYRGVPCRSRRRGDGARVRHCEDSEVAAWATCAASSSAALPRKADGLPALRVWAADADDGCRTRVSSRSRRNEAGADGSRLCRSAGDSSVANTLQTDRRPTRPSPPPPHCRSADDNTDLVEQENSRRPDRGRADDDRHAAD